MKFRGLVLSSSLLLLLANSPINALADTAANRPVKDYKGMALAPEVSGFVGWSAGAGLGVNSYNMNSTSQTNVSGFESVLLSGVPGDLFSSYGRSNVNKFSAMGDVFVGYGYLRDIYYVGANAGFNIVGARMLNATTTNSSNVNVVSTTDITAANYINVVTTQTKVSRNWLEPFLDLKLGGLITPETLAYGIVGVSVDSVTLRSVTIYNSSANTVPGTELNTSNVFNYSKHRDLVGLRLGAGTETLLTRRFGIAVQYVYTFFPTFNAANTMGGTSVVCDASSSCTTVPVNLTNQTRTALSDQQVSAQFIYHIN